MLTIHGSVEAYALVGNELGVSDWQSVSQTNIAAFAKVTDDYQWVHVDTKRAAASELGTTIAHGLYTLSLGPRFACALYEFTGFSLGRNSGYRSVRFPAPMPAGTRVRMRATLLDVAEMAGGIEVVVRQVFERQRGVKPVCVADAVSCWLV